jgi:hypothetical protein
MSDEGNVGSLVLDLINAEGDAASEPNCTVEVLRLDGASIARADHLQFPPMNEFKLPAFPQAQNLRCVITPSLYNLVQSEFFTLNDGEARNESAIVLRDPGKWRPEFTQWNALAAAFDALKATIANQRIRLKDGTEVGVMTAELFDGLAAPELVLSKMALLNLFAVLKAQKDPVSDQLWFNMVKQILVIDQERFVAVVDPNLYESVDHILNNIDQFKPLGFFAADSQLHTGNIPREYTLTNMISVKRVYDEGNVQFTMAKVQSGGVDTVLLDCDMDEHHNLIEHASDLFKHVFTGGTNPIDIHEYIVHVQKGVELGYELQPATATVMSEVAAD